jgi:hypothetical protein
MIFLSQIYNMKLNTHWCKVERASHNRGSIKSILLMVSLRLHLTCWGEKYLTIKIIIFLRRFQSLKENGIIKKVMINLCGESYSMYKHIIKLLSWYFKKKLTKFLWNIGLSKLSSKTCLFYVQKDWSRLNSIWELSFFILSK